MFSVQPTKLDPAQVDAANDLERLWAKVIAEETERERKRLEEAWDADRLLDVASEGAPGPRPQGNALMGLLGLEPWTPWSGTPWDELLPSVLDRCAARTGTDDVRLLSFAMEKCRPANWSALYWLRAFRQLIAATGELAAAPTVAETTGRQQTEAAAREVRKREALVRELKKDWPTIERDLRDSPSNGLAEAAKTGKYGIWDMDRALAWAKQNGKLSSQTPVASVPNSVFTWGR